MVVASTVTNLFNEAIGGFMGEYADMMLDGTCCQYCGVYIGMDGDYPQSCPSCAREERENDGITYTKGGSPRPSKTRCEICNKLVKKTGLKDHMRDKHHTSDNEGT